MVRWPPRSRFHLGGSLEYETLVDADIPWTSSSLKARAKSSSSSVTPPVDEGLGWGSGRSTGKSSALIRMNNAFIRGVSRSFTMSFLYCLKRSQYLIPVTEPVSENTGSGKSMNCACKNNQPRETVESGEPPTTTAAIAMHPGVIAFISH